MGNPVPIEQLILIVKASCCCRAARLRTPIPCPLRALRVRFPAAKCIYIDAFRHESVTRETLLRYTRNSVCVNFLLVDFCGRTRLRRNGVFCRGSSDGLDHAIDVRLCDDRGTVQLLPKHEVQVPFLREQLDV